MRSSAEAVSCTLGCLVYLRGAVEINLRMGDGARIRTAVAGDTTQHAMATAWILDSAAVGGSRRAEAPTGAHTLNQGAVLVRAAPRCDSQGHPVISEEVKPLGGLHPEGSDVTNAVRMPSEIDRPRVQPQGERGASLAVLKRGELKKPDPLV